jgi:hypothetical protein
MTDATGRVWLDTVTAAIEHWGTTRIERGG